MSGNSPIILLYHQVSPNKTTFIENYNINVEPNLFDNHMKILKEEYAPITFDEWNDAIKNNDDVSNRVLVTFDDGYKDVINYGAEILSKYDLDGMWFINGGMVNNDKVFWLSQLMYLYDNNYLDKFLPPTIKSLFSNGNPRNLNKKTSGVVITEISNRSPLTNLLSVNDIIIEVQKSPVKSSSDLKRLVDNFFQKGEKV